MNEELKLLPCPWCGESLPSVHVSEGSTFRWRQVEGCCAPGPEVRHDTTAPDQTAAEADSRRRAIEAWNRRTLSAQAMTEEDAGVPLYQRAKALADTLACCRVDDEISLIMEAFQKEAALLRQLPGAVPDDPDPFVAHTCKAHGGKNWTIECIACGVEATSPTPAPLSEADIKRLAAEAVQHLADSEPTDMSIEGMDLLKGTPCESMFVLEGEEISRAIELVLSNAVYDATNFNASPASQPQGAEENGQPNECDHGYYTNLGENCPICLADVSLCVRDLKKLRGLPPYNTPGNLVYQDGIFFVRMQQKYGPEIIAKAEKILAASPAPDTEDQSHG